VKRIVVAPLPARPEYITAQSETAGVRCAESFYPAGLSVKEHVHDKASITIIAAGSYRRAHGAGAARPPRARGSTV
jgi:hypothetical protein